MNNCKEITKHKLSIKVDGPFLLTPGLVYKYKILLERPTTGLTITPKVYGTS